MSKPPTWLLKKSSFWFWNVQYVLARNYLSRSCKIILVTIERSPRGRAQRVETRFIWKVTKRKTVLKFCAKTPPNIMSRRETKAPLSPKGILGRIRISQGNYRPSTVKILLQKSGCTENSENDPNFYLFGID